MEARVVAVLTGASLLPLELLDQIMDLMDDTSLLAFSLTSRCGLRKSRQRLFTDITLCKKNERADTYFDLLLHPHSTISGALKRLHLDSVFDGATSRRFQDAKGVHLDAKFASLESLWLSWMIWHIIPPVILGLLKSPHLKELRCDNMDIPNDQFLDLFTTLPAKVEQVALHGQRFYEPEDHSPRRPAPKVSKCSLHFSSIDATSLSSFHRVWDPLYSEQVKLTIDTFHLDFSYKSNTDRYTPFMSRLLQHIGDRISKIVLVLPDDFEDLPVYYQACVSSCTNLRAIHAGIITVDRTDAPQMEWLWTILKTIPSPKIESVVFFFDTDEWDSSRSLEERIQSIPWASIPVETCRIFPHLKNIRVEVGGASNLLEERQAILDRVVRRDFDAEKRSFKLTLKACNWTKWTSHSEGPIPLARFCSPALYWTEMEQESPLNGSREQVV